MSVPSPPSRPEVILFCQSLPNGGHRGRTAVWRDAHTCEPTFFVKYGPTQILAEGRTQQALYDRAQSHTSAPRIPRICDAFADERTGRELIVMEYVHAPTVTRWLHRSTSAKERETRTRSCAKLVREAVAWLYALEVPQDGPPGPVGGGIA